MKRFVSALLLLGGLLVAGGVNASVTNQNISGSTAVVNTGDTIDGSNELAFIFQTGSSASNIDQISLALWSFVTVASANFTIQLTDVVAGVPGSTLASTSVSGTSAVGSPANVNTYNSGLLGAIATTSLSPNTQYAIVLSGSSNGNIIVGEDSSSYTTTDGWLYANSLLSTNNGSSYISRSNIVIGVSATVAPTPSAVPTLSEWGQLMLALMVIGMAWHFNNNRQNSY